MPTSPSFCALSSGTICSLIHKAQHRIVFVAPGIQKDVATALVQRVSECPDLSVTINIDFDEQTVRMGYGTVEGVASLKEHGITVKHSPGLRSGILIIDRTGWAYTPTALYLEPEPHSDETPNAFRLLGEQVESLICRLSGGFEDSRSSLDEKAQEELGVAAISPTHFEEVESAVKVAPPVKFNVARQVRVFSPYCQYVEMKLIGASVQRHRIRIPDELQNIGANDQILGKLKSTFDLIEKDSTFSSRKLEDKLNLLRKNFTPPLPNGKGRVVLKSVKPLLEERLATFRADLEAFRKQLLSGLSRQFEISKRQLVDYYLPLVKANPPDSLLAQLGLSKCSNKAARDWLASLIGKVLPTPEEVCSKISLEVDYKDITYETLNDPVFPDLIKSVFPHVDWSKPFREFSAAAEEGASHARK